MEYGQEILEWCGEGGLKSLLTRYEKEAAEVGTDDGNMLLDMDTLPDYQRLVSEWKSRSVPSLRICEKLVSEASAGDPGLLRHSRRVTQLARLLARELNKAGCGPDPDLVSSAAMLHDIAKGSRQHASEGARVLDRMGYPEVAAIVARHMDIVVTGDEAVSAAEVVFLADKMTDGETYVAIEERFSARFASCRPGSEIFLAVSARRDSALAIRKKIEKVTGRGLNELVHRLPPPENQGLIK
jgi:putative nucleotidyltransferase with HDIG domain